MAQKAAQALLLCSLYVSGAANILAADSDSGRRVRIGGVNVNASYWSGPAWYSAYGYAPYRYYGPWGLYDPFWYSPAIHPALYGGFAFAGNSGEIKIQAAAKDASVYVDGAFAGTVDKLKSFRLEPGAYNLEIRDSNQGVYEKRIYVLSGKTLHLDAKMDRTSGVRP